MARNRRYHLRYTIEFKGTTTNNFMPKMLQRLFKDLVGSIARGYKQTTAHMEVEDLRKDKPASK